MRTLLVTSFFPPMVGGAGRVYHNLCARMPEELVVLSAWRDFADGLEQEDWRAHDEAQPYPIERVELLRPVQTAGSTTTSDGLRSFLREDLPVRWRLMRRLHRLLRMRQFDCVCLGQLWALDWVAVLVKYVYRLPLVYYIHGEEVTAPSPGRLYGRMALPMLRRADRVAAVSSFTKGILVEEVGVPEERVEVVPNGVDLDQFRPAPKNPALVERYGLQGRRVLVTVGRQIPRKGIDMTLRALPGIIAAHPDVHYLVVGEGASRGAFEGIAAEVGVQANVTFTGAVSEEELVDHFNLADLFVMANRTLADGDTEGFGLVFLEANACGKAVIGGRAGGAVDAIDDGRSGLLVDGGRPDEIAAAICRVLGDPDLKRGMEEGGSAWANGFGWDQRAEQFRALCERAVREG